MLKAKRFVIMGGKFGKTSKNSSVFSESLYVTPCRQASHPQVAVIGNMVEVLLRTAWAVGDEGLCHSEDCNRERNQFFMEILGFAWAFENPHNKCSGKGNAPQQKARGLGLPRL